MKDLKINVIKGNEKKQIKLSDRMYELSFNK